MATIVFYSSVNAMSTKGWLPLDQFEDTVTYMDEALNNYKKVKEDNGLLKIECDHTKVLLSSCESALEKRNIDIDKLKEDNALLLEALKVYMEIEREYHGFIPVILRPATNAIQSAIKKVENK